MHISVPSGKLKIACYVCCSEIELRSVSVEEWCVSSAFFLLQYVYLALELCMRVDSSRLCTVPVLFRSRFSVRLSEVLRCCRLFLLRSRSFLNISTPVTTTFLFSSVSPTISTSSTYCQCFLFLLFLLLLFLFL